MLVVIAVLVLTGCGEDKPSERDLRDKPNDPTVIADLANSEMSLDDFDLCRAVENIPDIKARISELTGTDVMVFEPYGGPLKNMGQECYVRVGGAANGRPGHAFTFSMSQGLEIATAVNPKHKEIYPGCFQTDPVHEPTIARIVGLVLAGEVHEDVF